MQLTYTGPAAHADTFAKTLENHRLVVTYTPPFETRDAATALAVMSLAFSVTGSVPDIFAAVQEFRGRFNDARIDGLPPEPAPSIRERLSELDKLLEDGSIDAAEHARQRDRILSEL